MLPCVNLWAWLGLEWGGVLVKQSSAISLPSHIDVVVLLYLHEQEIKSLAMSTSVKRSDKKGLILQIWSPWKIMPQP